MRPVPWKSCHRPRAMRCLPAPRRLHRPLRRNRPRDESSNQGDEMAISLLNEPVAIAERIADSARRVRDVQAKAAVLSARGLAKTYTLGEVVVHALRGVDL